MKSLQELTKNSSFCVIPFISLMVNTDTYIRYCCLTKGLEGRIKNSQGNYISCKDNFKEQAWNSGHLRAIRISMLNDSKVTGCQSCYLQEQSGRQSNRQLSNNEWINRLGSDQIMKLVEQAAKSGFVVDDPVYLDLRLGNLCNLKCRMCNPWNSSQIAKEHVELIEKDQDYADTWNKSFSKFSIKFMDNQPWFQSDIFWNQVIELIPSLQKVYLTGGEPTLIEQNFTFMQSCIDQGRNDIQLFFNTNCTNINKKFLELIRQFFNCSVNASIDGFGEVNDYIRFPSKWARLENNIEQMARMPNITLGITPTVQVYNILNLVEILNWVDRLNAKYKKNIFVDFLINTHPSHLAITILPDNIKQQALDMLEHYRDNVMSKNAHGLTQNSLNGVIGMLKLNPPDDLEEQVKRLRIYTKSLDKERKQDFTVLGPELAEFINGKE